MEKQALNDLIGQRLRQIREKQGLSLDQASERTGVSKPMLGQIERGQSNPTVSTLWKIADGLNVPFTAFIEEIQHQVKKVSLDDLTPFKEDNGKYLVYPIFPMVNGKPFEIFTVTLEPGCKYIAKPHPQGVEEYLWVVDGDAILKLNEREYPLGEQEGLSFHADIPHQYWNKATAPSTLVMVIYYGEPKPLF